MTEIENKEIMHQIQLGRVENGIVKNCLVQLENANRLISSELKRTNGVTTKARYKEIRSYLKDVSKELKHNVDEEMTVEDFIEYELNTQMKLYKKYGNIQMVAPNLEQLVTTATFTPYTNTSTFANYLDSLELDYFNTWDSTVRSGYLTGMTTPQIVRKVMGYAPSNGQVMSHGFIQTLRNSIEMNTRTALQSFAMETRRMIYDKNDSLFSGYRWVATLDRRTCIVCGNAESKFYKTLSEIDTPPLHPNCRCTIIPVIDGMEDLDDGITRASMNGQVDGNITFDEWLQLQSADVQKDVLGVTRYNMYANGTPMNQFVSDNRILTLKELKQLEL